MRETHFILETILDVQPQEITSDEDKSAADIIHDLAELIAEKIQLKIDPKQCNPEHLKVNNNFNFIILIYIINYKIKIVTKFL